MEPKTSKATTAMASKLISHLETYYKQHLITKKVNKTDDFSDL